MNASEDIRYVMAIDPGKLGCIALKNKFETLSFKMPGTPKEMYDFLMAWKTKVRKCLLEKIVPMAPNPKLVAAFMKLHGHYRELRALLFAAGYTFDEIRPLAWQKEQNCITKGNKDVSKARAEALFPDHKVTLWNTDYERFRGYQICNGD